MRKFVSQVDQEVKDNEALVPSKGVWEEEQMSNFVIWGTGRSCGRKGEVRAAVKNLVSGVKVKGGRGHGEAR